MRSAEQVVEQDSREDREPEQVVVQADANDLSEPKRDDREVVGPQAQRRDPEQEREAGGVVLGTMLTHLRQPAVAVLMKNAGWDYVFLDAEHGSFTPPDLLDFCVAARGVSLPPPLPLPDAVRAMLS